MKYKELLNELLNSNILMIRKCDISEINEKIRIRESDIKEVYLIQYKKQ